MPLSSALTRGLSFGKSKAPKSDFSKAQPPIKRPQASTLSRSFQKSTFWSGRQPPVANSPLTSEQILDLIFMLSQPVHTPMLTTSIARLKAPLTRAERSSPAHCLCSVHTWLELRWINDLAAIIGEEIGPRLAHLREAPRQLLSVETEEMLGMLDAYTHILPADDPDGSRMANPFECSARNCAVCEITSCKACRLSQFFQNKEAVRAVNACAKGRKRRSKPWPEACSWLDPHPGPGWELKWKKESLPVLSDRVIVRRWRKAGGQERLSAAMASLQAEVMANKAAVEKRLERATQTMKSEPKTGGGTYEEIVNRKWTVHEDVIEDAETLDLLRKMGMDDDDGGEQPHEGNDSREAAYDSLAGTSSRNYNPDRVRAMSALSSPLANPFADPGQQRTSSQYLSPYVECEEQADRKSKLATAPSQNRGSSSSCASTVFSINSFASDTAWTSRSSRTSRSMSIAGAPKERDVENWAASYSNLLETSSYRESSASFDNQDSHDRFIPSARTDIKAPSAMKLPEGFQAGSHSTIKSWAVFSKSPLGRARKTQMIEPVDEGADKRRTANMSVGTVDDPAYLNFF